MATPHPPIIKTAGRQGWVTIAMLVVALGLFLAGIFRPFTAVTKLWIFENEVSVIGGIASLWNADEFFLFAILLVFTLIFPPVKMVALIAIWLIPGLTREAAQRFFRFVSHLGKWSMLDVFIVAILVILMRSGGVAQIAVKDGLVLFTCAVLLTQLAAFRTGRAARELTTQ